MGSRIAQRLLDRGYQVAVHDLDPVRTQAVDEQGGTDAKNIAEMAGGVDVVLSCLTNDEVTRSVYAGPAGVFVMVRPGTMVLEMSTISRDSSQGLHRLGAQHEIEVLDVAISGSTPAAERGLLTLLVSGDEDTFRAAEPVFQARYHLPH
jgi:2-hydroxy-3-oxopropionate reductase